MQIHTTGSRKIGMLDENYGMAAQAVMKRVGFSKLSGLAPSMSYEEAFKVLDRDGGGSISVTELKAALVNASSAEASEAEIKSLIDQVDINGDGELQLDEFETFWKLFKASCEEAPEYKQRMADGTAEEADSAAKMKRAFQLARTASSVSKSVAAEQVERATAAVENSVQARLRVQRSATQQLVAQRAVSRLTLKHQLSELISVRAEDVCFWIAPTEVQVRVDMGSLDPTMDLESSFISSLSYKVVGDKAAISLLNRLSRPGETAETIRGKLAPPNRITLGGEAKMKAGIPPRAHFFAFAYPLDCLVADTPTLLRTIIGSVSRLDDETFFFFLLGGFCYFDKELQFVQANAISLKRSLAELTFDGPYALRKNVAETLGEANRFLPFSLGWLNAAGLQKVAWVNPSERPGENALHETLTYPAGAFVYARRDGSAVFYRLVPPGLQSTSAAERSQLWARGWAREHEGFHRLRTGFEEELAKSRRLRARMRQGQRGKFERWMRGYGILIALYYVFGCALFNYTEGLNTLEAAYFITQTVTTVGYGDLAPASWQGRLLCIFLMPVGTVLVMSGLYGPMWGLLYYLDLINATLMSACVKCVPRAKACWSACVRRLAGHAASPPSSPDAAAGSSDSSNLNVQRFTMTALHGVRLEVGPLFAFLHAFLRPLVILLAYAIATAYLYTCRQGETGADGIAANGKCEGIDRYAFLNALYIMMYTMTSIGYGDSDLVPRTDNEYVYFIFCMLILLTTLTVSLERVRLLLISRRIFLQDFCEALPNVMLREARRECRPDPTFTQDEFVLLVLEEHHVVDRDLINSIRKDFGRIENFGMGKIAVRIGNGEIEVGTVFEHLVSRGHILDSNRVDPTSTREDRNRKREAQRKAKSSTVFDRLTHRLDFLDKLSHHRHAQTAVLDDVLPDAVVDMSTPDMGYSEWFEDVWTSHLEVDTVYRTRTTNASFLEKQASRERQVSRRSVGRSPPKKERFAQPPEQSQPVRTAEEEQLHAVRQEEQLHAVPLFGSSTKVLIESFEEQHLRRRLEEQAQLHAEQLAAVQAELAEARTALEAQQHLVQQHLEGSLDAGTSQLREAAVRIQQARQLEALMEEVPSAQPRGQVTVSWLTVTMRSAGVPDDHIASVLRAVGSQLRADHAVDYGSPMRAENIVENRRNQEWSLES